MYVQVAVNVPQVSSVFDYHLPSELEGRVTPGCLVVVPFGKQIAQGVVLKMVEQPQVIETRPVSALLDSTAVLTPLQMQLAQWLADQTLTPLATCLHLMIPPGISQHADTLYRLNPHPPETKPSDLTPLQQRLLALLQRRGDLRGRQFEATFRHQDWKASLQSLLRRGFLTSQAVLPPPATQPKMVRTARLARTPAEVNPGELDLGKGAAGQRRQEILDFLKNETLPVPLAWVFAACPGSTLNDLRRLAEADLITLGESEIWRDPVENVAIEPFPEPQLTVEQSAAWECIRNQLRQCAQGEESKPVLLHGVTGSGKTEIYLQAVAETLRLGRQAIVLVPEIALTPQTLRRFAARFPAQVGVIHSRLSAGERYDTWRRARAGLLPVIVGPRSALFTPLPQPGLIVVDECHDESYYQSETPPFYHSVATAIEYARLSRSLVMLGSATPGVELVHTAQNKNWTRLNLPDRILAHKQLIQNHLQRLGIKDVPLHGEGASAALPLPPVEVLDMRQELKQGNRSIFSRALQAALKTTLVANQQAILFLNRRGSATYVFCRACGESLRCPRCDLPLTLHRQSRAPDSEQLICHTCNYHRQVPKKCPQCGSQHIRHYGAGTERVEAEVQALLPQARTLRWDAETTRRKGAHEILLSHFIHHRADVLIGTQMLSKGLDLPLVTLVGVVLADVGLNFPDHRAGERTFNVLTQVAGRAGRSPLGGRVILQTFQPEHAVIQAAAEHDFAGYYRWELEQRQRLKYPPFSRLARLEYRHPQAARAAQAAELMAQQLNKWITEGGHTLSETIGPAPCFFSRVKGDYRWQIVLRSPNPLSILRNRSLEGWRVEFDPPSLL